MLTRDQILKAADLQSEEVQVPEWYGSVKVQQMTAGELLTLQDRCKVNGQVDSRLILLKMCAACIVDDQGKRLFSDSQEDMTFLEGKSQVALERIFDVAKRLNRLGADTVEEAKKNSPPITSGASPTG